ncbi:MAG: MFS transporter [Opitutaceae bacterium]
MSAAGPGSASLHVGTLVYTRRRLGALFVWLLWGDFAWQLKERAAIPVAQLMLKRFGASDFLLSLLVGSLPAAMGMLVGPAVGVRSDRHRGRRGRRIPFLLFSTPFVVAGMVGLAFAPQLGAVLDTALGVHTLGPAVCRLIAFAAAWSLFEIFTIIANAVFGGLINDVVPASLIGRFFGLFRAVSLIAGVVFNFWLIGHAEEHSQAIFLGIGLLYGAGFMLMCLAVKEGEYPPPPPRATGSTFAPLVAYLRECFADRYYLWVFAAIMLGNLAGAPVNSFSVLYAKSINMDMSDYGKLLVATYVVSFALSFGLGWLADRFHPLRVGIATLGLYAVVMFWGGVAATDTQQFAVAFIAHGILTGAFFTGTASIGQRLFPAAKFAQFASASGIVGAFGYMVLPPVIGLTLDHTGHIYRHTFTASGVLAALACLAFAIVYRQLMRRNPAEILSSSS